MESIITANSIYNSIHAALDHVYDCIEETTFDEMFSLPIHDLAIATNKREFTRAINKIYQLVKYLQRRKIAYPESRNYTVTIVAFDTIIKMCTYSEIEF